MSLFKKTSELALLGLQKQVKSLSEYLDSLSVDSMDDVFKEAEERMKETFKSFKDLFSLKGNKYVLTIPYDRETQTFSYSIDGNELNVIVKDLDADVEHKTKAGIPEDVCSDCVSVKYNEKEKAVKFIMERDGSLDESDVTLESESETFINHSEDFEPSDE